LDRGDSGVGVTPSRVAIGIDRLRRALRRRTSARRQRIPPLPSLAASSRKVRDADDPERQRGSADPQCARRIIWSIHRHVIRRQTAG
jgi:hypothetical protein